VFPRVTSQKAGSLEGSAQFGVELDQCACDTELYRTCLTCHATSICEDQHIETIHHFDRDERLPDWHATRFGREIVIKRTAIDRDFARTGPQKYAGDAAFAAPSAQILLNFS
jgi:hypothetical protein